MSGGYGLAPVGVWRVLEVEVSCQVRTALAVIPAAVSIAVGDPSRNRCPVSGGRRH